MSRRTFALVVAFAAIFPCAARAQAPKPVSKDAQVATGTIQPGTYDIEVVAGGGVLPGTLTLTPAKDSFDVKMTVGDHNPPIASVVRKGSTLTLTGTGEGLRVVYVLTFNGATLDGTFEFNEQSGTVSGKRRR